VNVPDHRSEKSDPFVQLSGVEKLEKEIKSHLFELRNGEVWFPAKVKREHRRLKTSLLL
jgi:hypothetical protein